MSMKALEPVRLERKKKSSMAAHVDERKKEVQQLVVFFFSSILFRYVFFVFFSFCASSCLLLSFSMAADGWWAVRPRMVISRFHLSVCVWCSTKRTQTKVSVATRFHLIGWYSPSVVSFFSFFFLFYSAFNFSIFRFSVFVSFFKCPIAMRQWRNGDRKRKETQLFSVWLRQPISNILGFLWLRL